MERPRTWKSILGWLAAVSLVLVLFTLGVYTLAAYDVNKAVRVNRLESTFIFSHIAMKPGFHPVVVFRSRDAWSRAEWSLWPFRHILIQVSKARHV